MPMIDGLDEICEIAARNRDVAEDTARLAPEVRAAGGTVGLWTLAAPREVGGHELAFPELLTVFERLGGADPTVAWHAVNSIPTCVLAAQLDGPVADRIFADTDLPFGYAGAAAAGVTAEVVDGGYRLDGHYPFMTGARDSAWATAVATAVDPEVDGSQGPPDLRRLAVPMSDLEIHDTWNAASGMRGTGSHAVSAHNVFVPEDHVVRFTATARIDRPLYRVAGPVLFLPPCAAVAIGVLRSATQGVIDLVAEKISRFDGHAHFDDPRIQQTVADAAAVSASLSAGLAGVAERYWSAIEAGDKPSAQIRADLWSIVFFIFDLTRQHVSNLYAVGTSSAYATRNPVERALRDVHAMNATFDSFQSLRRATGRVLLGHDAKHPVF